jgi:FixJ family two-component response regulator
MLSGHTAVDSAAEAINEGAVLRFFAKPWDDEQLRAEIAEAFRQQDLDARSGPAPARATARLRRQAPGTL